jgi:hypothetical protein
VQVPRRSERLSRRSRQLARFPLVSGRAEDGNSAPSLQTSIFSAISSASSISTQRYRTVLSILVAEEELNRPQVPSAPVDQRRLGPAHGMGRVFERVQADAADPLGNEASVLTCRQMVLGLAATWEQALANLPAAHLEIVVHRLPRHLGQLEANRPRARSIA